MRRLLLFTILATTLAQSPDMSYVMSSSWSMWSPWSFCSNNVKIRVRACSTVRGFKCVGHNKEFQSCNVGFSSKHALADNDYDAPDPYNEDRKVAMRQLYQDYDPMLPYGAKLPSRPIPTRPPNFTPPNEHIVVKQYGKKFAPSPDEDFKIASSRIRPGVSLDFGSTTTVTSKPQTLPLKITTPNQPTITQATTSTEGPLISLPTTITTKIRSTTEKILTTPKYTKTVQENVTLPELNKYKLDETLVKFPDKEFSLNNDNGNIEQLQLSSKYPIQKSSHLKEIGTTRSDESLPQITTRETVTPSTESTTTSTVPTLLSEKQYNSKTVHYKTHSFQSPKYSKLDSSRLKLSTTTRKSPTPDDLKGLFFEMAAGRMKPIKELTPLVKTGRMSRKMRLRKINNGVGIKTSAIHPLNKTKISSVLPSITEEKVNGTLDRIGSIISQLEMKSEGIPEQHSGEANPSLANLNTNDRQMYEETNQLENKLRELQKRVERNRKQILSTTISYPNEEEVLEGDTARALSWLIANMTKMVDDGAELPVVDLIPLERVEVEPSFKQESGILPADIEVISEQDGLKLKDDVSEDQIVRVEQQYYKPKKRRAISRSHIKVKWSEWSLWSECNCEIQKRKRICIPERANPENEIEGMDTSLRRGRSTKCPAPQYESRDCESEVCRHRIL